MTITADLEFKTYYQEKLYITANVETGVIYNRSGRRMIALTNDFLIGMHRALEKECGDKVEKVLHHCGRKWGVNFGKGLDAEWSQFYEQPAKEFPLAFFQGLLMQEFGHNGWGVLQVHYEHMDKGVVWVSLQGAIMGDIRTEELSYPADALTGGILAGLFTHFLGRDIDCIQSHVAAENTKASCFLLSDPKRIESVQNAGTGGKSHQQILDMLLATTL
jgi:predicted hydrocarbon binding protein